MRSGNIERYLYTWNQPPPKHVADVAIDDDTLRDGFQGAYTPRISRAEQAELLRLTDQVGVAYSVIGFPSASSDELDRCRYLIEFAAAERLRTIPTLLARTHPSDVGPLLRLAGEIDAPFMVELFVGTSPLRRHVEGWTLESLFERVRAACAPLAADGIRIGLSLEDATRTPPVELATFVEVGVDAGVSRLTLCDTVGESLPEGARRTTKFVKAVLAARRARCALAWHGHNDKGCAVANSIAAIEAGADVVSGSFLGLGERTGNAALEQVIAYLHGAGSRRFQVDLLPKLTARLADLADQPIPPTAPIVGMQAFATTAGVHSAALLKARRLGPRFEDLIYSGVPATAFGRAQAVLLGPMSGLANARNVLALNGRAPDDQAAKALLAHAKRLDRCMSPEEIGRYLEERVPK